MLLVPNIAIVPFWNAANVRHSFDDRQDISSIQKALDGIFISSFPSNTVLAFNEAQRVLNRAKKKKNSEWRK